MLNRWIVITTPFFFEGEARLIQRLLETEGLERLHIRKPNGERDKLERLLDGISIEQYPKLSIHDLFDVAIERNLGGIHLNQRNPQAPVGFTGKVSRSCHSITEVARYKESCDYVFLSPIFPSISKEGYGSGFSLDKLEKEEVIDSKVFALGGIDVMSVRKLRDIPFGGAAVLGALWGKDPSTLTEDEVITRFKQLHAWNE